MLTLAQKWLQSPTPFCLFHAPLIQGFIEVSRRNSYRTLSFKVKNALASTQCSICLILYLTEFRRTIHLLKIKHIYSSQRCILIHQYIQYANTNRKELLQTIKKKISLSQVSLFLCYRELFTLTLFTQWLLSLIRLFLSCQVSCCMFFIKEPSSLIFKKATSCTLCPTLSSS